MRKGMSSSSLVTGLAIAVILVTVSHKQEIEAQEEPSSIPVGYRISITTVYDNSRVDPKLTASWGLSCVIRTPNKVILFDTGGDSSILLSNMEKLNIKPEEIDVVVISHIHGDHVGGLYGFLERNDKVKVSSFAPPVRV